VELLACGAFSNQISYIPLRGAFSLLRFLPTAFYFYFF
jgi:hypothetical protein